MPAVFIGSAAAARPAPSINDVAAVVAIKWRRLKIILSNIANPLGCEPIDAIFYQMIKK
jgi:hypothetical protein